MPELELQKTQMQLINEISRALNVFQAYITNVNKNTWAFQEKDTLHLLETID